MQEKNLISIPKGKDESIAYNHFLKGSGKNKLFGDGEIILFIFKASDHLKTERTQCT